MMCSFHLDKEDQCVVILSESRVDCVRSADGRRILKECVRCAQSDKTEPTELLLLHRGQFPDDLNALLQDAADRKWPFVEEKWQYKQSVSSEDKINSSELIRAHLQDLLLFLRDCIAADDPGLAAAVLFLLDRLLYWMDGSEGLLKVAKALHKRYPDVPIAPQVIIRQARVYLNTGKLRKAEFILSSLIKNNASTGCWSYQKASDQTLVQAVCLQVRGQVLQTLGLWLESAELLWASVIGFYTLPQPDKKGIGTSLGLLANILTSMNERDFTALQNKPHIKLSFLGETRHRLLSAAQAAKMAVVLSQYGSLYVLTNVVARGICLLSYSFSRKCPTSDQHKYMALAKEAFEIGLLTKTAADAVTSKLELHTFLKAAYSLTATHRWMSGPSDNVITATGVCRQALTLFVHYCNTSDSSLCAVIMEKIQQIKTLLNVNPFHNSDPHSFIPDSYRSMQIKPVLFTPDDFEKTLDVFEKHHKTVCEALTNDTRVTSSTHAQCITAFQTNTEVLTTEVSTCRHSHADSIKQTRSNSKKVGQNSHNTCSSGSYEPLDDCSDGGRAANIVDPRNQSNTSNAFRYNKGNQSQPQPMHSEAGTSESRRRNYWKYQGARTSSSSYSNSSSWEIVSGRSQSSIETEEDAGDPLHNINRDTQFDEPNSVRPNKGIQNQSQPMQEPATAEDIEDETQNTSRTQRIDVPKKLEVRTLSSSFGSRTSWEHLSGQSQSSIETEDDIVDPSLNANKVDADAESGVSNILRHNKGIQSQFQPINEPATTEDVEDETPNTSSTQPRGGYIRHNKRIQRQSQTMKEPILTEEVEDEPSNTSSTHQNDTKNLGARVSLSSCSSSSSWNCVLGQSQSSIETEEDAIDPSQNINKINPSAEGGGSNSLRHNKGIQSQSQPMKGPILTEDEQPHTSDNADSSQNVSKINAKSIGDSNAIRLNKGIQSLPIADDMSRTQCIDVRKKREPRSFSSSVGSRSSWEHLSGQSQSSIETEDDIADPSENVNITNPSAKTGDSNTVRHNKAAQSPSQPMNEPIFTEDIEDELPNTSDPTLNINKINPSGKIGDSNTIRHNKRIRIQSQPMKEHILTEDVEDETPNTSTAQQKDIRNNLGPRTSSSSFSSHFSWECVKGQSQSSIETEDDAIGINPNHSEMNNDANLGRSPSFSLCNSSELQASFQKLPKSPIADAECLELMRKKERREESDKAFPLKVSDNIRKSQNTTSDSFEELGFEDLSLLNNHQKTRSSIKPSSTGGDAPPCTSCFENCIMGSEVLTELDYRSLLAGVCHRCLVERLPNKPLKPLEKGQQQKAYDAVVLKYSKASDEWMGCETSVYIGEPMGAQGQQRRAIQLQYLHQEQLLSSYVGKEYLKEKGLHAHLDDVERQMTAQYYVNEFNKCLYDNNVTTQIFFIPSEVLLVMENKRIVTCLSAEPYMSGTFVKLTNNTNKTQMKYDATKYGIAFGHFTYEFSNHQEVVVDLQGWITANGKGLTYLTDPQIHSLIRLKSSRSQQTGINNFIRHQHGEQCNEICRAAGLTHITAAGQNSAL
ncbi:alpha-protein kinase 1 isoform X2 [Danio rerio]|uniref:Alpha-protein kinase 1 isoform X2 n=1 Tax=Danio rerio TaxID=7955 RepID=A0AC58G2C7_DANRE